MVSNTRSARYHHKLSKPQWNVFCARSAARFRILIAGRRFGKTFLAIRELMRAAVNRQDSVNWYIAPTYRMAKQIAWHDLKRALPDEYIDSKNEQDLSITLVNGSVIALRGADNPDSLRGPGLDFVVLDEAAFMISEVWGTVVRPMLSDRNGAALFISTPCGFNWLYDLFMDALSKPNWARFLFTTAEGGNVPPEELEDAKANMDIRSYRQEYEASFENLAGRVYYTFDRILNVEKNIRDFEELPLRVGMDFNVNPMSATLGVRVADQLHLFNEILIPNGDTELMCQELKLRYPNRHIIVYPDPTANARRTNAEGGRTDISIIRSYGFTVLSPSGPYSLADKINMTNAALCNAKKVRRVLIKEGTCPNLIKGLDGLTYKEGTSIPDKSLGLDHITDSFAYMACWEFPIENQAIIAKVRFA